MDRVVETEHPVWGGVITDLSVAFNFTESAKLLSELIFLIFIQILIMDQPQQLDRD
jgi:hypothetical protein